MQLDSPPMLEHLFLESPWAVMAVCVIAAAFCFFYGLQRRKRAAMLASLALLAPAVGVYLLAQNVTTPREQLLDATRDLVMATAPLDATTLDRLLAPEVVVTGPDGSVWVDRGNVLPRVESALRRYTLNSQTIRQLDAVAHDTGWAESAVRVRTDFQGSGAGPVNTDWRLSWRYEPGSANDASNTGDNSGGGGGWRVVEIRWLRFNGLETQQSLMP